MRKNQGRTLELSENVRASLFASIVALKFCHTDTEKVAGTIKCQNLDASALLKPKTNVEGKLKKKRKV